MLPLDQGEHQLEIASASCGTFWSMVVRPTGDASQKENDAMFATPITPMSAGTRNFASKMALKAPYASTSL